jgi:transposase InsO family protein
MNAYAERFVRSVRRECLDRFVIFTQTRLRRIVGSYIDYYNNYRPHQGLHGIPNAPPEQPKSEKSRWSSGCTTTITGKRRNYA